MQHTPAPWRYEPDRYNRDSHHHGSVVSVDQAGNMVWFIATMEDAPNAEANANLIAAAPDLYDALQSAETAIQGLMDAVQGSQPDGYDEHDLWVLRKVQAALAKAEGR